MTDQNKLLPTLERILYDAKFGADTRFGLGDEQIFVDPELAESTIIAILTDPDREFIGIDIDFFVNNILNFNTPENIINTMNSIYDTFRSDDVNFIFFQILQDAFVNKKEFEEIFKTSWVALQIKQNVSSPEQAPVDNLNIEPGGGCFVDPALTPTVTPSVTPTLELIQNSPTPTPTPTPTITATVTPTITPTITSTPASTPASTPPVTPPAAFSTIWDTTSPSESITIPFVSFGTYDCNIDWGDGSDDDITVWNDAAVTHTYASAGTHTVEIRGTVKGYRFANGGDRLKIKEITSWGPLELISNEWFHGCSNMIITATNIPTMTPATTSTFKAFRDCTSLTTVPNFGDWDMSNVENMEDMFRGATLFNQDINGWNVSGVTNMIHMFFNAQNFNQNLNSWNTGVVTNMLQMFAGATDFNGDVTGWDTGDVSDMRFVFQNTSFDQNLGAWDLTSVTSMDGLFTGVTLSTANYNATLVGWEGQVEPTSITFGGGNSTHSGAGTTARGVLVNTSSWTITDGGPA